MKIQNGFSLKPLDPQAKAAQQDAALKDAAKMYENHFLNEMVKAMRSTTGGEDGLIKKNMAEKIFSEQLDQKYVENWANKGGVGLADMIYTQIKEKYYGDSQKHIRPLNHALPIAPEKNGVHGIPASDSIQFKSIPQSSPGKLGYRFEVPTPVAGKFEVQAPMAGKIVDVKRLDQSWSSLALDHGDGLRSELTFPGTVDGAIASFGLGADVEAGQKLGVLDSNRPALAWNLDWT